MIDIILFVFGISFIIAGIVGCILPVIPGPPLSYLGILFLHFTSWVDFSTSFLLIWFAIVIFVTVIDYIIPAWSTKKFGGSKWGSMGSLIGLFIGLFAGPFGIFIGAFVGAFIGEVLYQNKLNSQISENPNKQNNNQINPLKAAAGAFLGLILGIVIKISVSVIIGYIFVKETITAIF